MSGEVPKKGVFIYLKRFCCLKFFLGFLKFAVKDCWGRVAIPTKNKYLFVDHCLILGPTQAADNLLFSKLDYGIPWFIGGSETVKQWNCKIRKKVWIIELWDTGQLVKM